MNTTRFDDTTAMNYVDIINRGARLSGETHEYIVGVRLDLLREKIAAKVANSREPFTILDFGCGVGVTEQLMVERFPNALITGVDTSRDSISQAKALKLQNTDFHVTTASGLPFATGSFDAIYTNGTFHHIDRKDHADTLRELNRVLKPNGDLFIFENNPANPLMMKAMRDTPFDKGCEALRPRYLSDLARQEGFCCNKVEFYCFFPHFLRHLRFLEKYLRWLIIGAQYVIWAKKSD